MNRESYLTNGNEILGIESNCDKIGNWTICRKAHTKNISHDLCLANIIQGKESKCAYEEISYHETITQVTETTIIINDVNNTLETTCGVSNRHLYAYSKPQGYSKRSKKANRHRFPSQFATTADKETRAS